ncbi:MAG: hypothetical protein ACJ788_24420 [Ktedonobacteraceae bacterium]
MTTQSEHRPCWFCSKARMCRRVRKPKRNGRVITFVFVWLCEPCVYYVETV